MCLSITGTLALLISLPRVRMGPISSLGRKLVGQGFVKCDTVPRRSDPPESSSLLPFRSPPIHTAPHTTPDDLGPVCTPRQVEARALGDDGTWSDPQHLEPYLSRSSSLPLLSSLPSLLISLPSCLASPCFLLQGALVVFPLCLQLCLNATHHRC